MSKENNKLCKREFHGYENGDGTFRIEIIDREFNEDISMFEKIYNKVEIGNAEVIINAYATKNGHKLAEFIVEEKM